MPKHPIWGFIRADENGWRRLHVIGTRSHEPEIRQQEIKIIPCGEPITLRLEPKGRTYPHQINVYSARGVQVGYLKEEHAERVAKAIRAGVEFEAFSAVEPNPDAYLVGLWINAREKG